ncbi:MAG TPA: CRTAC1 family protein [Gemmatimonadales bacterium]|nr:CRTAC1 family protein [Gemmatimonadales bacterium]
MTSRSWRHGAVIGAFLAAIVLVVLLNRRAVRAATAPAVAGFQLTNVATRVGIDFVHHGPIVDSKLDNIAPFMAALGASVSVTDVNNDGWPDLYFTNSRFGYPNALYLNRGDGTFVDVAREAGLADLNRPGDGVSMGAVWGDYDNDGLEDVLVYKWGYLQLFKNMGNLHFKDVTEEAGLHHWMNSNGAVWFDYDRDGLLDLYVSGYFRSDIDLWHLKTTRIMENSFEFATNGGNGRLFHNLGNGRFEDVTDRMGINSTRWTLAVAAGDFNGDGWPDLFLANDYGPEELYLNDHGRRFVLSRVGLESDSKSGMSATLGDVLNRGRLDAFVTNISERAYLFQGNNLRLNFLPELGRFQQGAEGVLADAGWAWGAQLGDLGNDGRNELFIVNGYISGDRNRSYWYAMSKIAGANGNVFEDARNWPPIGTASLSGYERSRVLVNRGLAGWTDVAAAVGVTDEYDGRAVAFADLFNRGVLDVVVANQNQPALVYRNSVAPGNHWIGFKLVGTRSNRSAIGAAVTLEAGGARQLKLVDGGMGFASQNDRRLHFGLGQAARVDRVVIRWPSGTLQTIERPAADRLHVVTEPGPRP